MERKEEMSLVLNDLLKINNDRIKEYRKASREISDFDWRTIFLSMIDESTKFGMELALAIQNTGCTPRLSSTTTAGKIYRFWSEVKETFTGRDRESILNACEFVEEAVQNAYTKALDHGDISKEVVPLLLRQKNALRASRDTVNRYRDTSMLIMPEFLQP